MKLGLIADIHADPDALDEVLKRLRETHVVDLILCAGDLSGYGDRPNEVIDRLRAEELPTVKGNHDSPSADITPENADYLRALPFHWRGEYDGYRLFMCHGLPEVNFIGFSARLLEREQVREMVRELAVDFIITGHTHFYLCERCDDTWILNPGAVYTRSAEGTSHSYGILDLTARTFVVHDVLLPTPENVIIRYDLNVK